MEVGDAVTVGDGDGVAVGDAVAVGVTVAVRDAVTVGDGVTVEDAVVVAVGDGEVAVTNAQITKAITKTMMIVIIFFCIILAWYLF